MKEELLSLGERIRAHRRVRKLSQRDLAERTGMSLRTIVNLEYGSHVASLASVIKVARAFGLTTAQLLTELHP